MVKRRAQQWQQVKDASSGIRLVPILKTNSPSPTSYKLNDSVERVKFSAPVSYSVKKEKTTTFVDTYIRQQKFVPSPAEYTVLDKAFDVTTRSPTAKRNRIY